MSLVKKISLLSVISVLPALSMDGPQQLTLDNIENMTAQQLADSDFKLRLGQEDWNKLFPGMETSDDALNAKTKVHLAMRLRSEKVRINQEETLRSIDSANQYEKSARTNIGQGLDLGITAEGLTQDLSVSIKSILEKMAQLQGLSQQSGDTVTQINRQIEALRQLLERSSAIDTEKEKLLADLRQIIQNISEGQNSVNRELPELVRILQEFK